MDQITKLSINILKLHPRNTEFFDDIEGENYEMFKKSIAEDGIITPLIVSPDMTIISGHQRYKAAKDLNIELVPVIIREDLVEDSEQLKKLLATNFGRLKNNPMKQSKMITEYEKLCDVYNGNHKIKDRNNYDAKISQEDIANQFGVSVATLTKLKQLQ